MERSDYLEKQINQLGKVLGTIFARLLALKNESMSETKLLPVAAEALKNELDIDMDELLAQPDDTFIENLQTNLNFSPENLDQLADILTLLAHEHSGKASLACIKKYCAFISSCKKMDVFTPWKGNGKIEDIRNNYL